MMSPDWLFEVGLVLALALTLALSLVWLWYKSSLGLARWRKRRLARRARFGELEAARLLEKQGYVIEAEQAAAPWPVSVGGELCSITLRADYLVRRGRERFVAEVKTGALVASIRHGPTRRQLLEYQLAYAVHGVVLVDVLSGALMSVRFPALSER